MEITDQKLSDSTCYNDYNPIQDNEFYFQWHITDRCNLRCSHCYQNEYSSPSELSIEGLKSIADKITDALIMWKKDGRIAITGGEPFIRKDLFNLLNYLEQKPEIKKIGILTNGTFIKNNIQSLKNLTKLHYIQLSLEGGKEKNDEIRGKGIFDQVIESTNLLKNADLPVRWMVTLHKGNVEEVPHIIDLALENKVDFLTFERLIPTGSGKTMDNNVLSPQELSEVFEYIVKRSNLDFRVINRH